MRPTRDTPEHDIVLTADGGRVVGTVVEESPDTVMVLLLDGTFRRLPAREVVRIEYAPRTYTPPPPAEPPVPPSG